MENDFFEAYFDYLVLGSVFLLAVVLMVIRILKGPFGNLTPEQQKEQDLMLAGAAHSMNQMNSLM